METKTYSLKAIGELVEQNDKLSAELSDKKKQLNELTQPVKPIIVESEDDYNLYSRQLSEYASTHRNLKDMVTLLEKNISDHNQIILSAIPEAHIWFRLPVGDSFVWVGKQGDSWGGHHYGLRIENTEPTFELREKVYYD